MSSLPEAPVCWAAASAAGKTTVAGWKTEALCRSSCSTTCEAAPLTSAAKSGVVRRREIRTSLGPSEGPISPAIRSRMRTGRSFLPARAEPNQSWKSSLVRSTAPSGTSS